MSHGGTSGRGAFRRRGALDQWSLHFGPNMTPMVDVVMVILVFFMCSAAFVGPEWFLRTLVPVKAAAPPPRGAGADPLALPPSRIDVVLVRGPDGRTLASAPLLQRAENVTLDELTARFMQHTEGTGTASTQIEVMVRPARDVPYRDVVRVHEAAERAGITRVGISTK